MSISLFAVYDLYFPLCVAFLKKGIFIAGSRYPGFLNQKKSKMRQVSGSQMVVKIGRSYYRRV